MVKKFVEDYFQYCPAETRAILTALFSRVRVRRCVAGEILISAGDPAEYCCFVKSGRLRMYVHSDACREKVIAVLAPGHHIGMGDVYSGSYSAYAAAMVAAEVFMVPAAVLKDEVRAEPLFAEYVIQSMAYMVQTGLADMAVTRSDVRLLLYFRWLMNEYGKTADGGVLELPRTKTITELSDLLMATRETTSRNLARLKADGLLDYTEQTWIIRDPLRMMALIDCYNDGLGYQGSE